MMDDLANLIRGIRIDLSVLGPPGIDEAIATAVRSWLLSEERVEAATRGMTPLLCGTQEDELGNEIPDKQFNQLTPDWQNAFRRYARAALSSAIGEPYEFSGWVEVVEDDRE